MAAVAYNLEYFAPSGKKRPNVRVAKNKTNRKERTTQRLRMFGNLCMVLVVVGLACGVLYTQTTLNELTAEVIQQDKELTEQTTLYAYLNFEMDSASSLKNIEEKAKAMGMVKVNGNQIGYVQVEEGESIQLKEDALDTMMGRANNSLLNAMDYLSP